MIEEFVQLSNEKGVQVTLLRGDSLAILNNPDGVRLPDGGLLLGGTKKVDAVVTDPPYGFDFAGDKDWDTFEDGRKFATAADDSAQFAKFTKDWSYRLRSDYMWPGAHLLAFSADRTIDLVGRGLREAGYDIVRLMFWLYATGQVKNPNDLRPGCEPIFCARVPTDLELRKLFKEKGRGQLNAQDWKAEDGKHPTNVFLDESLADAYEDIRALVTKYPGTFFESKPSVKDRDYGCEDVVAKEAFASKLASGQFKITCADCGESRKLSFQTKKCPTCKSTNTSLEKIEKLADDRKNTHPTVKPIMLMRRMIRLISRPKHLIIDPFLGSGTTGIAAVLEGRNFIGIEREKEFFDLDVARITAALKE